MTKLQIPPMFSTVEEVVHDDINTVKTKLNLLVRKQTDRERAREFKEGKE